jgi:hypothetical protein
MMVNENGSQLLRGRRPQMATKKSAKSSKAATGAMGVQRPTSPAVTTTPTPAPKGK